MNTCISINEIRNGINCCLENSLELISDSELLLINDKYARAYSVSQLAIEEAGKAMMLYELYNTLQADGRKDFDFKKFRKNFRDHRWKTYESKIIDLMMYSQNKTDNMEEYALNNFKEIQKAKSGYYDKLKNDGFYVSLENNIFFKPNQIFHKSEVLKFIEESKAKIEFIEVWIKKWLILDKDLGIDKEGIVNLLRK
jgi:AbiV family abortive infection protein